jgi:hypothetical protein
LKYMPFQIATIFIREKRKKQFEFEKEEMATV